MRSRKGQRGRLAAGGTALGLLLGLVGPAAAQDAGRAASADVRIDLMEQTAIARRGGTFEMRLRLDGAPADGTIQVVLHQRVRSRSELAASMDGNGLRNRIVAPIYALSELPEQADGTRRVPLSLDPTAGGVTLQSEGVYPVEVRVDGPDGADLGSLVTHLILPPEAGDESPPLGVAVLAEAGVRPGLQPDGSVRLPRSEVEAMAEVIAGLAAVPDVPATLAATPETLDALRESAEPGDVELADAARTAAEGRSVLALPYVEVSVDALASAGLIDELDEQRARGRRVLAEALGSPPVASVAVAPADLGAAGLADLARAGVTRVVVDADQVGPLDPGLISYSLAQPFELTGPPAATEATGDLALEAMALDPTVQERLSSAGSPGLVASRVLSELAFLRLEQPSVARSIVTPIPSGTPARVIGLILEGLGAGPPFRPVSVDEAFDHAEPLLDAGDNRVTRSLLPAVSEPIPPSEALPIVAGRTHLDSFTDLVGPDNPATEPLQRHLLMTTAGRLTTAERRAHLAAVESAIDAVAGSVSTPATFTLTLTARDGTVPLTVTNGSGMPLRVVLRLESAKLEFPDGDTIDQVLSTETTRIDLKVRARATGAFPLVITVLTPDEERTLATTRYTVRSTAVSGAGLLLSIGAGLFLIVWWARHWRRTRRSARLIAAHGHPAGGAG